MSRTIHHYPLCIFIHNISETSKSFLKPAQQHPICFSCQRSNFATSSSSTLSTISSKSCGATARNNVCPSKHNQQIHVLVGDMINAAKSFTCLGCFLFRKTINSVCLYFFLSLKFDQVHRSMGFSLLY